MIFINHNNERRTQTSVSKILNLTQGFRTAFFIWAYVRQGVYSFGHTVRRWYRFSAYSYGTKQISKYARVYIE